MKRAVIQFCRYLPIGAAVLGLAVVPGGGRAHAADNHSAAAVKAAYLFRFAGYVDWPEESSSTGPFTIAVLGSPAVARELKGLLPNHYVNNRPARMREVRGLRDLGRPQILFVGSGYAGALRVIMPAVGREPMLLVTDENDGLNQGHRQSRDGCLPLTSPDPADSECGMREAHIGAPRHSARSERPGEKAT